MILRRRKPSLILHIGLGEDSGGLDVRRLTLAEVRFIGTYTYSQVDLQAAVAALHSGALGELAWVRLRALAEGPQAFAQLASGQEASAKVVLTP